MTAPALELLDVDKRFSDVVALERASLAVRAGTVHALLGENGAGKTTLMRIAFGMMRPDAGVVRVDATNINVFLEIRKGENAPGVAR